MTLKEKVAQMTQLMGDIFIEEGYGKLMGISYGFEVSPELAWNIGSVLGMGGAQKLKAIQKSYIEKSRNAIPLLFMVDIIHGYRTIFPSPLAMACSWQPELIEKSAEIAAKEAAVSGVHVTFSPMADLARDARWGRVIEGTGEDPMLNCLYTEAFVKGYQGKDVKEPYKIAACVKHFAGYGAAEAGRDYNTTEISEYQLKENYLPAYKAAVDVGCKMVMSAFNALNGVPCTGNKWLFQDLLRKEWGFKGTVITDCTALYELIPHGFSADTEEAAVASLEAGMDIEMVSTAFFDKLEGLVYQGQVDVKLIDQAVERILELKDEMGLFENPYKDADEAKEEELHLCDEHRKAARDIAVNSMVLLKNENTTLPLSRDEKIALVGPYAKSNLLLDIWKCEGKEEECITLEEGLKGRIALETVGTKEILSISDGEIDEAVEIAKKCDKIVLTMGEHPDMSSEAGSRAYINISKDQIKLAKKLDELGKKIIVVLLNGRPMELGEINEIADAILVAWFPGTEGGNAVADILLGDKVPTGRLAMGFPHTVGQLPLYYNSLPTGRPMQGKDDTERFRSRYIDAPNIPDYPFGYGLTYTTFEYSPIKISAESMKEDDTIIVSVMVKNTGHIQGTETVQFYLRDMAGSYARPVRMLKDFSRITLEAGEEKEISFVITIDTLKYNTRTNGYAAEKGEFVAFIGADSLTENGVSFKYK